jgi:hypothetical protein
MVLYHGASLTNRFQLAVNKRTQPNKKNKKVVSLSICFLDRYGWK